jgi:hypothetical protein
MKTGYVIVRKSGHPMYSDKQVTIKPFPTRERATARLSAYGADYYVAEIQYKGSKIIGSYPFTTI